MAATLAEVTVCIVGLGLMGGSLAAALTAGQRCRRVIGIARRQATLTQARELGYIAQGYLDPAEGLREAQIIILATPVRDIIRQIQALGPHLAPGCLVIDLGSTKQQIIAALNTLPANIQAIGGHPMCGKESSGLEAADAALYQDKLFMLCPLERTGPEALALASELVSAIGARRMILDAAMHDRLVAAVSHVPYLASVGIMNAVIRLAACEPQVWDVASSGFRDATRLAASDVTMMQDILLTNREPIITVLTELQGQLAAIKTALGNGDEQAMRALQEAACGQRKELQL